MYIATSSNGYWGRGRTADAALAACAAEGGRGDRLLFRINDAYVLPRVTSWGSLYGEYGSLLKVIAEKDVERADFEAPEFIAEAWEIGARGKRTDVTARYVENYFEETNVMEASA
jgi:hypothetical protein